MTEDELYQLLLAKGRTTAPVDPAILRVASRHILAFMNDLTPAQQQQTMAAFGRLIGEIETLERAAYRPSQRATHQPTPKPKAFDKFVNFITLDWLV